jgi:hypothetical protein
VTELDGSSGLPDLHAVTTYLQTSAWTKISQDERTVMWHREFEDQDLRIVLPASQNMTDYVEQLYLALKVLSYIERRSAQEISSDMIYGASDTVSVRLFPDAPEGEAPLAVAYPALSAMRNYVIGSGAALETHALVLPANRSRRAESFANSARLSTHRGSFILTLSLPLWQEFPGGDMPDGSDGVQEALLDVPPQPFGRQVANRMVAVAKYAQSLADEVGNGNRPIRAFGRLDRNAPNATELEALSTLGGGENDTYQIRFAQSPIAGSRSLPSVLRVTPGQQRIIRDGAVFLRTMQSRNDASIEGYVVRLARDRQIGPGEVVIQGIIDDSGKQHRVHASLTEEDYREAVRAHQSGLKVISRGDLDIRGNYKYIRPMRKFAIVPGMEEEF